MKWMHRFAIPALCGAAALAFGCASTRPGDVPSSADAVGDGSSQVVYTSSHDGTIWVTDANNNSIVYSGYVHAGDVVTLDPDQNRLTLNGSTLSSNNINHDEHRIYFLEGEGMTPAPPVAPSSNVQRPNGVNDQAILKGAGSNLVQFTVSNRGVVWVTDSANNLVLYSGRVAPGDQIVVDPDNNKLTINGNKVYGQDLNHNNHQIFFLSDDSGPASPGLTQ
jgi:signal peptidase I